MIKNFNNKTQKVGDDLKETIKKIFRTAAYI